MKRKSIIISYAFYFFIFFYIITQYILITHKNKIEKPEYRVYENIINFTSNSNNNKKIPILCMITTFESTNEKAKTMLGWIPQYGIKDMMSTAWNWEKKLMNNNQTSK